MQQTSSPSLTFLFIKKSMLKSSRMKYVLLHRSFPECTEGSVRHIAVCSLQRASESCFSRHHPFTKASFWLVMDILPAQFHLLSLTSPPPPPHLSLYRFGGLVVGCPSEGWWTRRSMLVVVGWLLDGMTRPERTVSLA